MYKQQRNRRKCIITISGIAPYFDNSKSKLKKIAKQLQKNITHSSISIKDDKEYGLVLVIQGDWRKEIKEWLLENEIFDILIVIVTILFAVGVFYKR